MIGVRLESDVDFDGWRSAARGLAAARVEPHVIVWGTPSLEAGLFGGFEDAPGPPFGASVHTPRAFIEEARLAACHRDPDRFDLLYRVLLRLQREDGLWSRTVDPDIHRLLALAKSVRRDRHKMTAFVRFREIATEAGAAYVAWFEPVHRIVELTSPFFVDRFAGMRWSILTPERSAHWTGADLVFGPGATRGDAPSEDALEAIWRTYYVSIFNPARLKTAAMQREMPKKYWANLPEAALIAGLVRDSAAQESRMIDRTTKAHPRAAAIRRQHEDAPKAAAHGLEAVREESARCTRCPLHQHATQTVFGEGLQTARLVFVGEQPGDSEDLAGKPFVGPAGRLFDRALAEAGIARADAYVTNAVKHFKYLPRGKKRIHQKPNAGEIDACRWWVDRELAQVKPRLAVALGATALRSLTGKSMPVIASRGQVLPGLGAERVIVTVHPSFLLRLPDEETKQREWAAFVGDLRRARALMEA